MQLWRVLTAARETIASDFSQENCKLGTAVLYHKGQAILHLRHRLSEDGPRHDSIILTPLFLSILDQSDNDSFALRTHVKLIDRVIRNRGGIENLNVGNGLQKLVIKFKSLSTTSVRLAHKSTEEAMTLSNQFPSFFADQHGMMQKTDLPGPVVASF